jgi:hypothetical protein
MFSAFSFGKIIKTILPGAILTTALLLLVEGFWTLWRPGMGFLLGKIPNDWVTPVTAGLIPLSLLLGFFLNTFTWMALNHRMRARSDSELDATVYAELRKKLSEGLWEDSAKYFPKLGGALGQVPLPSRPPLEYYYLPVVTLTNLNYLWESYFCWYEFDINSACALLLTVPAAGFLLWVKLPQCHSLLLLLILALLAFSWVLYMSLRRAAVKNLVSYEKNLLLLITGSLVKAARNAQSSAADDGGEVTA